MPEEHDFTWPKGQGSPAQLWAHTTHDSTWTLQQDSGGAPQGPLESNKHPSELEDGDKDKDTFHNVTPS